MVALAVGGVGGGVGIQNTSKKHDFNFSCLLNLFVFFASVML